MVDLRRPVQCLVIQLLCIFTGAGSGRPKDLKTDVFFESLHDKDTTDPFRQITDVDYTFNAEVQPHNLMRKDRHHHHHYHHNHKHHKHNVETKNHNKEFPHFKDHSNRENRKSRKNIFGLDDNISDILFNEDKTKFERKFDVKFLSEDEPKSKKKKIDYVTFVDDQERWPRFEEIELLAGVSGWRKERWKEDPQVEEITEKPKSTRTTKFMYRRVQGTSNGSKRNAIIAVSAIAPDVKPRK